MSRIEEVYRLQAMADEEVQGIWDAICELDGLDRADLGVEWQEDVYAEISERGLRVTVHP